MPKLAVAQAEVSLEGLAGDWQNNRKYHGGPDRAVCLYSVELYEWLAAAGIELSWGALGENFTTRGIDLCQLGVGDRLLTPACMLQITGARVPCNSLNRWDRRLCDLIKGRSGWLARVVRPGIVHVGDSLNVEQEPS